MKRSVWKLSYIHSVFFKPKYCIERGFALRLRYSVIPKLFISKKIGVYNGVWNLSVTILSNMVGLKFGMLAFTRRIDARLHVKNKKSKRKNKKK